MIARRLAPALTLACAAALTLGLSACAPEDSPGPTSSGSTGSGSAGGSASATPTPTASADAVDCLTGTWTMDQAGLEQFYGDINALMTGAGVVFTPEGSAQLTLGPDGTYTWAPDAAITAEVSGTTILVDISGRTEGAFTATADRISSDTQSTEGLVIAATIDGTPTDAGAITEQIAGAPVSDASYTCSADTLTLVTEVSGSTATSVLHR